MKTLVARDDRGIGDRFATAMALAPFHRRIPHITYLTLDRDLDRVWPMLKPFCSEIRDSEIRHDLAPTWSWNADNLVFQPRQSFYFTRINTIAELTNTRPGAIRRNPFNFPPHNSSMAGKKYVVLHPYASTPDKSMPEYDIAVIKHYCAGKNIPVITLPLADIPLSRALGFVTDAALVIAVDSCISHFAYWLRPELPTIVCYYNTSKDFIFPGLPEPLPTLYSGTELARIKQQIDKL